MKPLILYFVVPKADTCTAINKPPTGRSDVKKRLDDM